MNNNFLIYGNDEYLIEYNINKIKKAKNDKKTSIIYFDMSETSIEEVIEELNTFSLFDNNKIVICKKAIFLSSNCKKDTYNTNILIEYLKKSINDNILIITNNDIDERKKIVKEIKNNCKVIKCDELKDYEIEEFISKKFQKSGYKIDKKCARLLLERAGNNLMIINNEIKKLIMYKLDSKTITLEDVIASVPKKNR